MGGGEEMDTTKGTKSYRREISIPVGKCQSQPSASCRRQAPMELHWRQQQQQQQWTLHCLCLIDAAGDDAGDTGDGHWH